MGWIREEFVKQRGENEPGTESRAEEHFEACEQRAWAELAGRLEQDVEEYRRLSAGAELQQISEFQCRIANTTSGIAVVVTADLAAHTIRYAYGPEKDQTAAPEGGILSLRSAGDSVELYSADQRVSSEQARRLILEPLLFPPKDEELEPTGT